MDLVQTDATTNMIIHVYTNINTSINIANNTVLARKLEYDRPLIPKQNHRTSIFQLLESTVSVVVIYSYQQ